MSDNEKGNDSDIYLNPSPTARANAPLRWATSPL
jgi:hypothetical protein